MSLKLEYTDYFFTSCWYFIESCICMNFGSNIFSDNLSVLARETLRLEKFDPFILDAESADTPWLISAYLKVQIFYIFS